jgi:hypothetical protein
MTMMTTLPPETLAARFAPCIIRARNVNDAYYHGMIHLHQTGTLHTTRNGEARVAPTPVITVYGAPHERVLLDERRDANPFFHLMEALWMLRGCDDVAFLAYYLPDIAKHSDNGTHFHGAYGARWNRYAQLERTLSMLAKEPSSRRAVLNLWDAQLDCHTDSKDIPCNDAVKFYVRDDVLHMIVFNRSNDAIWGAYGANAVHFSALLEYAARRLELGIGTYTQFSSDFHAYTAVFDRCWPIPPHAAQARYLRGTRVVPLLRDAAVFTAELRVVIEALRDEHTLRNARTFKGFRTEFFETVLRPMAAAFYAYRTGDDPAEAANILRAAIQQHGAVDWFVAAYAWMQRRVERRRLQQKHSSSSIPSAQE